MKKEQITVKGTPITIIEGDYISLTDIAKINSTEPDDVIKNWLRTKNTIMFLGTWEMRFNPDFKPVEFDGFKTEAGLNSFTMSPKRWIESTNAIGIRTKSGRYGGGTYAHKDIAFAFCYWVSPDFQLYVSWEFQRLKSLEAPEWDMRRALTKVNYKLHTSAIRKHIIPALKGKPSAAAFTAFTEEADLLNLVIFGITAAQWRNENPELVAKGRNIRDTADIYQLIVLANMESYNETLIHYQMGKEDRFYELEKAAIRQLETLYKINPLPPNLLDPPNLLPPPSSTKTAPESDT